MVLHLWNPKWPAFVWSAKTRFSSRWKQKSLVGCAKSILLSVCQFSQNRLGEGKSPSPVSFSVFILAPDLSFDCSRVLDLRDNTSCLVYSWELLADNLTQPWASVWDHWCNTCSTIVKSDQKIERSLLLSTMNRIKQGTERETERRTERVTGRETERRTERRTDRGLKRSGKRSWERRERRGRTLRFFNVHCDPHPIYCHLSLYKYPRLIISHQNFFRFKLLNSFIAAIKVNIVWRCRYWF